MRTQLFLPAPELVPQALSAHPSLMPLNPELLALALPAAALRLRPPEQLEEQAVLGEVPLTPAVVPLPVLLVKAAFPMKLPASMERT